jgi:LuxR family maltose regulon positive regulatory protein
LRHENPALISLECLSLWHMYQQEEATELLDQLEKLLNQREASLDPDRVICLKNDIRLHRAGINVCGGKNPAETLRHLDEIDIGLLSDFYRGIQHNIRGLALSETNQFDEALVNYRAAARIYRLIETSLGLACSYYLEALMELERGNLQALDRLLASAPEEPVFRKPSARYFYPSMLECIEAILCYERGNPARAFELLEANLTLAVEVGHHKMVSLVQITYARLLQEEGRMEDAEKQLRKLAAHLHRNEPGSSRAMILADYELIRLALANSKIIAAQTLADHYSLPFNGPPPPLSPKWDRLSCLAALAWCRAQLALGEADKALDILRRIARMARQAGRKRRYLECRILEAIALDDLGDDYEAMDVFSSLLAAAAEEGLVRLIADEGERSLSLVRRLKEEGGCVDIDPAFIGRLLKSDPKTGEIMAARENGATLHLDQFSDKEQNLLRLVAMGKSNEEISHRLSITRHTVKWHLGNIFIKLQVKNRTAAVVAAKANRLI